MDTVEQFEVSGLTVRIEYDTDPESPRDWDNLGTMVCFHRRYTLGDKHEWISPEVFRAFVENPASDVALCLPLYLYDHSGITMNTSGFACPWDSGQVGWIYITRAKIRSEYSAKRISKKLLERVRGYLVNEVKTYDEFLTGQVYGYTVESDDGTVDESCWGFYGLDYVKAEARNVAEYAAKKQAEREASVSKMVDNNFAL